MKVSSLRPFAALLTAIEGALVLVIGLGFVVDGLFLERFGEVEMTERVDLALALIGVMTGLVLLRGARILSRPNATLSTARRILLFVVAAFQAFVALPLLWFTFSDPVDPQSNIVITVVCLLLLTAGVGISPLVRWGARP